MTTSAAPPQRRWEELRFIIRGSRRGLLFLSALALVAAVCEAFLLGAVVQSIAALSQNRAEVGIDLGPLAFSADVRWTLAAATAAAALRGVLVTVVAYRGPGIAAAARARLRNRLLSRYLEADWEAQSADKAGRLTQTLLSAVNDACSVLLLLTQALPALLTLVVLMAVAVIVDPAVTGVIALLGVALAVALRPLLRWSRQAARADARGRNATASLVVGVLTAGAEISVAGSRRGVLDAGRVQIERTEGHYAQAIGLRRVVSVMGQSIAFLIASLGLFLISSAELDIDFATVGTITVLLLRASGLSQQILATTSQYGSVVPFIEQVRTTIDHWTSRRVAFGDEEFPSREDIVVHGVAYSYPGVDHEAVRLDHAVFAFGTSTAVLGRSGAGKSTFIQLLLRLRTPSRGDIRVGNRPLGEISESAFVAEVAYVPQAPRLVPGTIADNIVFFRTGLNQADVERAARLAHVHADIARLDGGYETILDSHVDELSGGQKQRLALARALITAPSVLVLDEPTSALDAENEAAVIETLRSLAGQTTVIIITHDHEVASICDSALVLDATVPQEVGQEPVPIAEPEAGVESV